MTAHKPFPAMMADPRLIDCYEAFYLACHFSRAWDARLKQSLLAYGDHGPFISGCGRDHFPEMTKADLRQLAQAVTKFSDMAHAARPCRVRKVTIRKLGRAVAGYYGSGFYGPQSSLQGCE